MSTTITEPQILAPDAIEHKKLQRVWTAGIGAGIAASVATTATAVLADAVGVSLDIAGDPIPMIGFANLTMIGAVLGIALAAVFARRARHPRATFVRATVALTVLSLVPDAVVDADVATRMVLGLTHVVAAAIIVPVLSRRLAA